MSMTTIPATAQESCFRTNVYGEPKRSLAVTAEALKTMTRPMKTNSAVAVNRYRSTLTRLAITLYLATEARRQGGKWGRKIGMGVTGLVHSLFSIVDFRLSNGKSAGDGWAGT